MTVNKYIASNYSVGELAKVFHGTSERSADDAVGIQERVTSGNHWYDVLTAMGK